MKSSRMNKNNSLIISIIIISSVVIMLIFLLGTASLLDDMQHELAYGSDADGYSSNDIMDRDSGILLDENIIFETNDDIKKLVTVLVILVPLTAAFLAFGVYSMRNNTQHNFNPVFSRVKMNT